MRTLLLVAGLVLTAPVLTSPALAEPAGALVAAGEVSKYRPIGRARPWGMVFEVPLLAGITATQVDAFQVDPEGSEQNPDTALDAQLRVGAVLDSDQAFSPLFFRLEYEHDLFTGVFSGGAPDIQAIEPPLTEDTDTQLRRAYGRVTLGPILTLSGGFTLNHWGLGLLANDGAHGWTPGSAYFGDPRGGDRVLRGMIATGPWTRADLLITAGYDVVQGDDVLLDGDEASQVVAAVVLGYQQPNQIGLFGTLRKQEADDGAETNVAVIDAYGKLSGKLSRRWEGSAEVEAAWIFGDTDLGPNPTFAAHDIFQFGVAGRFAAHRHDFGGVLDVAILSGDQNNDDGEQNAFKADRNFELGLLLFRHVLAATTARAPIRASDPNLVGLPAEDLDRVPTRGAVSNTTAFFPRAWWRPLDGLEIYGGPLFAFAESAPADPRNTRFAGGQPRNAFDAVPGSYLGTEFDLGVRQQVVVYGMQLTLGVEAAVAILGDAFVDADDRNPDPIFGGRAIAQLRL